MILSHKWRFIFVKNKKVAGTSVEALLASDLGPLDVATPLRPPDESFRFVNGNSPQNWLSVGVDLEKVASGGNDRDSALSMYEKIRLNQIGTNRPAPGNPESFLKLERRFYHHITAIEILEIVPQWMWDEYLTFCIERHPYEKAVSSAYWHIRSRRQQIPFDEALEIVLEEKRFKDWYRYTDANGKVCVDEILRFENLEVDLQRIVVERLGIDVPFVLPGLKTESRSDRRPAMEILTSDQKRSVQEVMAEEFDYFAWPA